MGPKADNPMMKETEMQARDQTVKREWGRMGWGGWDFRPKMTNLLSVGLEWGDGRNMEKMGDKIS